MSKNDFNATINLPKTDFPMRAGLAKREPDMLRRWNDMDLYNEMLKKNDGKPRFSLHDGPPFSNGNIHMGHALNKALKDFIVRSYAMRGYYTPYIPGWDNHGMPIESAIIKEQKLNHKAMSIADFRSACHDYAQKYIDRQMDGFKRMGVVADWEHPYKTMNKGFEAEEVRVFGKMYRNGHIYKGLKPVYWCAHDETALAEAEIEYQDDPCTTVYVKFPMHDDLGKLPNVDHSKLFFVIWTPTIWTLPGNLAIALNPRELYNLVQAPNGEVYVMADALTEKVMHIGGFDSYEVLEQHPGAFFENMLADHPFLPKTSRLVLADYVTMDSGTGCVHTAPGFGADDYLTCKRYGMDMVVPVDDQGRHTDYAGKYAGMSTEESNPVILADMKAAGSLFASEDIVHSYPHCWRCKSPIIFRATPQWFCSVDSFKEDAVAACENVRWLPVWGKERMAAMIRERADWCISRQRRWGLPIPVFYCDDCHKPVCTEESIEAVAKLFEKEGSNAWFDRPAADILPEGFTCPHCGGKHFTQETDTLDGWFDSGSTHVAAMQRDQGFWPADMYIEGGDQYRGWFQSSLLVAVGALGKGAPYRECLTHGWTVDGEGRAMHKSLGNGKLPQVPQHRALLPRQPRRLRRRAPRRAGGYAPARPLGDHEAQRPHPPRGQGIRQLRVPRGLARDQRLLRRGALELLPRHHQGPPLLRRAQRTRAPQRADGAVPHPRQHDEDVRADPRLHLRRDLAGHAAPRRGRRAQRAAQRHEPAVRRLRAQRERACPVGSAHPRALGRQRCA